jgi:Protein of unknown function (DUF2889)
MPQLAPPPRNPAAGPPPRRPGSVRRTSSLLMSWPDGIGRMQVQGRARDLLTPVQGEPEVMAQSDLGVQVGPDRVIEEISATPAPAGLSGLVGARGGGGLRRTVEELLPDQRALATPLHLLLDDLAGATLIGGFALSRHPDAIGELAQPKTGGQPMRSMAGICSGWRLDSSTLDAEGNYRGAVHHVAPVPRLDDPTDSLSWHDLEPLPAIAMRRARRIDVHADVDGQITVDAMFRDSCREPDGTEVAVHEYHIDATVDAATGTLMAVVATPRVLPFAECPLAAPKVGRLHGLPVADFRSAVLERLRSTDCCTHLNDALRALAEVPVLATVLEP